MKLAPFPFLIGVTSNLWALWAMLHDMPTWVVLLGVPGVYYAWFKMEPDR